MGAADLYNRARARGKDHPHAVRILARAWLYIIWHCWQTITAYNLVELEEETVSHSAESRWTVGCVLADERPRSGRWSTKVLWSRCRHCRR
jgi:hypothetical protein